MKKWFMFRVLPKRTGKGKYMLIRTEGSPTNWWQPSSFEHVVIK